MSRELVQSYLDLGLRICTWPRIGDIKGPHTNEWQLKTYTIDDYTDGCRVGILTGHEMSPGKFVIDVDIDWGPGSVIAQFLLPPTGFIYGRASKRVSHCLYTTSEALTSFKYEDIDKTSLIELRGTKLDGSVGYQSMAPPSVWSKEGKTEALAFVKQDALAHIDPPAHLKQRVCLAAIGMIIAKHLGKHGFGHDARLCWAGFLLRAGLSIDECVTMGEAISAFCENREVSDVRLVVESTAKHLNTKDATIVKKIKGGPSLIKILGDKGKLVVKRINEWLGRDSDFIRDRNGITVRDHQENIKRALTMLSVDLSYNEFSDKLLVNRSRPMEDRELTELWLRIDEEFRFRPSYAFFEKVIKKLAWDNPFHPVKDYLNSLTWDGTPRIDDWLVTSGGADATPFVRAIGALVLIAAVRRIREPGCKYDELLVLESGQGLFKSTALRTLCPNPEWFSDDLQLNVKSQQMIESTLGKWIIEISELSGMRQSQLEQLKSTLSRQVDGPARMAYAHLPVERARQFIGIGTTNSGSYLIDIINRRFWPVHILKFDIVWIAAHRDQLWAEASMRESKGESIRLPEALWPEAGVQQEKRREIDPWEDTIVHAIQETPEFHDYRDGHSRVITDRLWTSLNLQNERKDRHGQHRIAQVMQRLGFKPTAIRTDNKLYRGYVSLDPGWVERHYTKEQGESEHAQVEQVTRQPGEEDEDVPF